MHQPFFVLDVFSSQRFAGNPLALVPEAATLTTAEMQSIASEFNHSETVFLLPSDRLDCDVRARIFTPKWEVPFAGHPTVGAGFWLARQKAAAGGPIVLETGAGSVAVAPICASDGSVVGAEIAAPQPLVVGSRLEPALAAACLNLDVVDLRANVAPQIFSVGLPFLIIELTSRQALARAAPNLVQFHAHLPLEGADAIYAYTSDIGEDGSAAGVDLMARMFSPLDGIVEDPATGSASCAAVASRAERLGIEQLDLTIGQGFDLGRPSVLRCRTHALHGLRRAHVGGRCVLTMEGSLILT